MNHGDCDYRRDVTMNNSRAYTRGRILAAGSWQSWREGDAISLSKTGDTLAWSFELPAKEFILFAFDHGQP